MTDNIKNNKIYGLVLDRSSGVSVPFKVKLIFKGDTYGLKDVYCHDNDMPIVEFYDARYNDTIHGQLIDRYYLKAVMDLPDGQGLNFYKGVEEWQLSNETLQVVKFWLKHNAFK